MAFAGFRHAHINGLYALARERDDIEIVAACEEDAAAREAAKSSGFDVTHESIDAMLESVECDVVAIGDYYTKRGDIAIRALTRGRSVIADKPLCTRLAEVHKMEEIVQTAGLKVGCMLDMRNGGQWVLVRKLIQSDEIGEVHAVSFGGQHPLMLGSRPAWYFEPGKHGGTINDIAIHAVDYIPWATGQRFTTINAARCWNAFAEGYAHMEDAGQMMLAMSNGCGVLGDVSYFAPNSMGYTMPWYWRMTVWGRKGVIETSSTTKQVLLGLDGQKDVKSMDPEADNTGGYLADFLADLAGTPNPEGSSTPTVLRSARVALTTQRAADEGLREVAL